LYILLPSKQTNITNSSFLYIKNKMQQPKISPFRVATKSPNKISKIKNDYKFEHSNFNPRDEFHIYWSYSMIEIQKDYTFKKNFKHSYNILFWTLPYLTDRRYSAAASPTRAICLWKRILLINVWIGLLPIKMIEEQWSHDCALKLFWYRYCNTCYNIKY
jgi:hypothetical protein